LGEILAGSMSELAVVLTQNVYVKGDEWPWECAGLFQCHRDLSVIAARILNEDARITGGSEILGFGGISGCPEVGRAAEDPGYFAMALKPRCVSAPSSDLFAARISFLSESAGSLSNASWSNIGSWLGAIALERNQRVAITPLFDGVLRSPAERSHMGALEASTFLNSFGARLPDTRWYSQNFGWRGDQAFQLQPTEAT
jgi:hypothetical protein